MAEIDASIALGVKPLQIENPMNAMLRAMQIKGLQQEQEMGTLKADEYRQGVERRNRLQSILSQDYAKPDEREAALLRGGFLDEAGKLGKDRRDSAKTDAETKAKAIETAHKQIQLAGQAFGYVKANPTPENAVAVLDSLQMHGVYSPEQVQQMKAMVAANPGNVAALADQAYRAALATADQLPKYETRNLGGTTDTLAIDPVTGKVTVANTAQNTQSPDNAATNSRLAAEGALNRGQAERHFQAGQSAPQYMETDAGLVALPRKLAPGQAPAATPVMGQDGQPLGKPLKPIPPSVNSAIIQNTQSLNQIDRALKLLSGKDIGDPANGGQRGDANATGVKGYLPQTLLNRMDPKGVDARAEVADIGSLKIHDRSGAAVTISESPRLMPFIPQATDDAVTVKKKLARLRTELVNEANALQETYSKDQGYKPSPVKPTDASGASQFRVLGVEK